MSCNLHKTMFPFRDPMCICTRQTRTQTLLPIRARASFYVQTISCGPPLSLCLLPFSLSSSAPHPLFCPPPTWHVTRTAPAYKFRAMCVYVNTETPLDNNKETHTHPQSHAPHKLSLMYKQISFRPSSFSDSYPPLPHTLVPTTPLSATHAALGSPSSNV